MMYLAQDYPDDADSNIAQEEEDQLMKEDKNAQKTKVHYDEHTKPKRHHHSSHKARRKMLVKGQCALYDVMTFSQIKRCLNFTSWNPDGIQR